MSLLPAEQPRYEEMAQVVELYIKNENPTAIARHLGIPRKEVLNHIDEWRNGAVGQEVMKERVEELIATMDEHYSSLIRKYYEIIEEVDNYVGESVTHQLMAQKANAIKGIAELERQRIDMLQKSGLLEAADMGAEIAAMEEKHAVLIDILKTELCDVCKPRVMQRLSQVTGQPTVIVSGE